MVFTFTDTGAQLTFDLSDIQVAYKGGYSVVNSGDTMVWEMPPMIFEEGTYKIAQKRFLESGYSFRLVVERSEDGSFVGQLEVSAAHIRPGIEIYFDEGGRVSGYQCKQSYYYVEGDPRIGEHTGSLLEEVDIYPVVPALGTVNIDLSSVQIIDKTKPEPPKEEVVLEEIAAEPLEEEVSEELKTGFAPLSPSSISIDEQGVLRRLKDNGDWEPVYLLACCQFASMNAAEERNGVYYATPASGALQTGVSGKDGMGTIASGTLERSTTDLAHELSEMIRAQHAYAANTKVLSTLDDMLTELERL
jgi:hypothetical protein